MGPDVPQGIKRIESSKSKARTFTGVGFELKVHNFCEWKIADRDKAGLK